MDQCEDREEGVPPSKTSQRNTPGPGPEPSCVSLKSDWSKTQLLVNVNRQQRFKTVVEQQSPEFPRSQSAQQHQTQLDSIFLLLEDKMVTFVKKELKKLQKLLTSNHSQSLEKQMFDEADCDSEEEEKRSNREAFMKITLHFLRKMKQEELAERLQSMIPAGIKQLGLINEKAPEKQRPYVDQQDRKRLHLKKEEEKLRTTMGEEQFNVKKQNSSFSFIAVNFKHNETARNSELNDHEDNSDSIETEVKEDDEKDNYVNIYDSQLKHLPDNGSKTEVTNKDCGSSPRVPESGVKNKARQKPFCCSLCDQRFRDKGHLNSHMRIHTGEKPFSCKLCDQRFTQKGNLNIHMRIHTGEKPFFCELCERRFSQKQYLNKHVRIHTGQKPFCCELCERRFTQKSSLNTHMRSHTGQKPFSCELCDQKFSIKGSLNTHMRVHDGQKPFGCELCDRRFITKGHLNTHMRMHTGQKPYCCELCEQRFSEKGSLIKHMRVHTGQKPFSCELCDRKFSQKGSLNSHMRIHTGQKPFSCVLCDRRFREKGTLNRHMRIHIEIEPVVSNNS